MYLIPTSLGLYQHGISFDSFLGSLFKDDDKDFKFLLCDGILPACQMSKLSRTSSLELVKNGQDDICKRCFKRGSKNIGAHDKDFSNQILKYSEFISPTEIEAINTLCKSLTEQELRSLQYKGAPVGEHGYASALRFFASGDLSNEKYGLEILRKYVVGASISFSVFKNIFKKGDIEKAIIHHGIYTPQGLAVAAANQEKVDVITWVKSYRDQTFLFSHKDTYHHTMISEPKSDWNEFEFNKESEQIIDDYVASRRSGENDWISFNTEPINVPKTEKLHYECLLLTSVLWDAQVHYKANLFDGILDWVLQTISFWIETKKTTNLCIRIHPAEVTGYIQSRQRISDEIKIAFPKLPKNIIIVEPEDKTSTYDLVAEADYVVAYSTKASIEVGVMGKPIIVCGDAWVRNKEISLDPKTEKEYFSILRDPAPILNFSKEKQQRAKKYAFHFFMRRMIKIDCFDRAERGEIEFNPITFENSSTELQNSLDVLRDGIYNNAPFLQKAELFQKQEKSDFKFDFLGAISKSSVLKSNEEVLIAQRLLEELGLPIHHDKTKNWDLIKFITAVVGISKPDENFLDAGCGKRAVVANTFSKLGFKNVYACDILPQSHFIQRSISRRILLKAEKLLKKWKNNPFNFDNYYLSKQENIRAPFCYSAQDLAQTSYQDSFFSTVCCLSVIEHLESAKIFIDEMARIIKSGGQLLITTDYWPQKVYTKGIYPYGREQPEMTIFSASEIQNLIKYASSKGFSFNEKIDLSATDRLCSWDRVNKSYTFIFLRFNKL